MGEKLPFRLILASASPARRYLLGRAGYDFEVMPADIDEPTHAGFGDPRTLVQHIAWLKAAAVAKPTDRSPWASSSPTVVIAADTIGWLNGQVIAKPADQADAKRIIRQLSGTEHALWTGVCLWLLPNNIQVAWQEMSRVAMKAMSAQELDAYLETRTWQGCAGAYAIEEKDDPFVRVVEGSVSNVIGLPMETLEGVLEWLTAPSGALGKNGAG